MQDNSGGSPSQVFLASTAKNTHDKNANPNESQNNNNQPEPTKSAQGSASSEAANGVTNGTTSGTSNGAPNGSTDAPRPLSRTKQLILAASKREKESQEATKAPEVPRPPATEAPAPTSRTKQLILAASKKEETQEGSKAASSDSTQDGKSSAPQTMSETKSADPPDPQPKPAVSAKTKQAILDAAKAQKAKDDKETAGLQSSNETKQNVNKASEDKKESTKPHVPKQALLDAAKAQKVLDEKQKGTSGKTPKQALLDAAKAQKALDEKKDDTGAKATQQSTKTPQQALLDAAKAQKALDEKNVTGAKTPQQALLDAAKAQKALDEKKNDGTTKPPLPPKTDQSEPPPIPPRTGAKGLLPTKARQVVQATSVAQSGKAPAKPATHEDQTNAAPPPLPPPRKDPTGKEQSENQSQPDKESKQLNGTKQSPKPIKRWSSQGKGDHKQQHHGRPSSFRTTSMGYGGPYNRPQTGPGGKPSVHKSPKLSRPASDQHNLHAAAGRAQNKDLRGKTRNSSVKKPPADSDKDGTNLFSKPGETVNPTQATTTTGEGQAGSGEGKPPEPSDRILQMTLKGEWSVLEQALRSMDKSTNIGEIGVADPVSADMLIMHKHSQTRRMYQFDCAGLLS